MAKEAHDITTGSISVIAETKDIRSMIYFIRGQQVMLDSDLAKLYHVETKVFNQAVNRKFDRVFRYIEDHAETEQKVFFDGQIYDAFSLIVSLIQNAKTELILIDGYVDVNTLNILSKKNHGVNVKVYTYPNAKLTNTDILNFNAQYPRLVVKRTSVFHDRFIILDGTTVYHVGASLKDAGKKCFAISLMEDSNIAVALIKRLETV